MKQKEQVVKAKSEEVSRRRHTRLSLSLSHHDKNTWKGAMKRKDPNQK